MAPWIDPGKAATISVEPAETGVTTPVLLLIVATDGLEELQVTWVVISWLVPSENAPMATNCWMVSTCKDGTIDREDKVAEVTVRIVLAEILPEAAVMVVVPAATPIARPLLLLIVATEVIDELQMT